MRRMQNFLVVGMLSRDALHPRWPDGSPLISVCPGILAQSPQDQAGDSDSVTGLVTVYSHRCHKGHCEVSCFGSGAHFEQQELVILIKGIAVLSALQSVKV
jgi:hypothetical protein